MPKSGIPVEEARMDIAKLIRKAGVLECINYLSKNKKVTKTDLIRKVAVCQQSVCSAVEQLVQAGIVSVQEEHRFPRRKYHSLTPVGLELAQTPLASLNIAEQE